MEGDELCVICHRERATMGWFCVSCALDEAAAILVRVFPDLPNEDTTIRGGLTVPPEEPLAVRVGHWLAAYEQGVEML